MDVIPAQLIATCSVPIDPESFPTLQIQQHFRKNFFLVSCSCALFVMDPFAHPLF